jgi:hypothetical protein
MQRKNYPLLADIVGNRRRIIIMIFPIISLQQNNAIAFFVAVQLSMAEERERERDRGGVTFLHR